MYDCVNEINNVRLVKDMPKRNSINSKYNKISGLTLAQKHVLAKKFTNFSSLMGLGGSLRASRVEADELKYSSHLILNDGDNLEITIRCNFSKLRSGESEFRV